MCGICVNWWQSYGQNSLLVIKSALIKICIDSFGPTQRFNWYVVQLGTGITGVSKALPTPPSGSLVHRQDFRNTLHTDIDFDLHMLARLFKVEQSVTKASREVPRA